MLLPKIQRLALRTKAHLLQQFKEVEYVREPGVIFKFGARKSAQANQETNDINLREGRELFSRRDCFEDLLILGQNFFIFLRGYHINQKDSCAIGGESRDDFI